MIKIMADQEQQAENEDEDDIGIAGLVPRAS